MRKLLPLLVALLLPITACGDGGPFDPMQAAVGTYTLVQVNGSNLPVFLGQQEGVHADVVSGSFTMRSDSSYTETVNVRFTPPTGGGETLPFTENGTFRVIGSTVQFETSEGAVYSGRVSGNKLIYDYSGFAATYQKQ